MYSQTTPVDTGYSLDDYIGRTVVVHMGAAKVACGIIKPAVALKTSLTLSGMAASTGFDYHIHEGGDCTGGDTVVKGKYSKRRERASRIWKALLLTFLFLFPLSNVFHCHRFVSPLF